MITQSNELFQKKKKKKNEHVVFAELFHLLQEIGGPP